MVLCMVADYNLNKKFVFRFLIFLWYENNKLGEWLYSINQDAITIVAFLFNYLN